MTTADLIAARLRAAARTTLVTWTMVLLAVTLVIWISGHHRMVRSVAGAWIEARPVAEVIATVFVAVALMLLTSWRRQVESRLLGLIGREWVSRASVFLGLFLFVAGIVFLSWFVNHPQYHPWIINAMPWVIGGLVTVKFVAGAVAIRSLRRRRLVSDRTLGLWAAAWLVAYVTLFGLLRWLVPTTIVATHTLAMGVTLMLPLARFAAMPLALHWNRHR